MQLGPSEATVTGFQAEQTEQLGDTNFRESVGSQVRNVRIKE